MPGSARWKERGGAIGEWLEKEADSLEPMRGPVHGRSLPGGADREPPVKVVVDASVILAFVIPEENDA